MSIILSASRRSILLAALFLLLLHARAGAQQDLTFTPFHTNGIYQPGRDWDGL